VTWNSSYDNDENVPLGLTASNSGLLHLTQLNLTIDEGEDSQQALRYFMGPN